MAFWNRTKIVATIGPASDSKAELSDMLKAGADVIRVNGAHGRIDEHRKKIRLVRDVSGRLGIPTAILLDLPGPKLRLGDLKADSISLRKGQAITLACGEAFQKGADIPVKDGFVARSVKVGSRIFINDGIVEVKVKNVVGKKVRCKVVSGGVIKSRKGINLPNVKLPIPSLTSLDRKLLALAVEEGVDYVGLSFVRSAENIRDLRRMLGRRAPHIGIVAKIEKPEALADLDRIIEASDAIMVARGDLGIEMPYDEVPIIQKRILEMCSLAGKPTITATQMMESMVNSERPTRAEATDVASAVWEGTDAVMLSEETSIGQNPARAVEAMARIAFEAEKAMPEPIGPKRKRDRKELQAQVLSFAAGLIADELNARAIVTPTRSGRTARYISCTRPRTQIIALTEDERTTRRMCLYWGVKPMNMPAFSTVDEMLAYAKEAALKSKLIKKGDRIIITSGAHGRKDDITRLVEVSDV